LAIFLLWDFYENYESRPNVGATFLHDTYKFDKKWVGLHFGPFITNSSGHPA
jgi:hypothetical protein